MGAYRFVLPPGWKAAPLLPGDTGLLVAPQVEGVAILVLYAIAATGTLEEELDRLVAASCRELEVLSQGEAETYKTRKLSGVLTWARVREARAARPPEPRQYMHIYALLENGAERVPVILLGGPTISEAHRAAFTQLLLTLEENPDPLSSPFVLLVGLKTR